MTTTSTTPNPTRRMQGVAHALYFVIGGIWAVMGKRSFETVTGPKVDYWLVRTVGGLLTIAGGVIASASLRNRITPEIRWLAYGTSGVLACISLLYSAKGRIRSIYLLDAVANAVLIAGWRFNSMSVRHVVGVIRARKSILGSGRA
jgi:hypothetical protein